ncbi:5'-methylthioadenosine/S-adenosylhomocysteine nucleosidase family protein [Actinomadura opuntiae]|uniref:5'-methylthioadenosine/S-adenosylhomocysteine nucleosidase family protein n=1 Tax=Actinomadura sp. OS1-43 TaxID=604315 RepID=UPI00255AB3DB|nr:5'-methylthioadenosine/S-adenosylhomocysteine nucleosidase [Actinomadura sp. OS1-43]MDL4819083.1 5'-methylthioadenosine/S-adenosylhomocysteine nucleosidase [Actinomadura sp. OS1-43]
MNEQYRVSGIMTTGGTTNVETSAVGDNPVVNLTAPAVGAPGGSHADVGVITLLSEETQAVRTALDLHEETTGGLRFYTGDVPTAGGPVRVAAVRALGQGQRSTMAAYGNLRRHHDPHVIVLAGIGGAIHSSVKVDDVVIATRVVYYDLRKETPQGTRRRGEEREAPAELGHAVNAFFTDHDPGEFSVTDPAGTTRTARFHHGPIGSGEAVIADREADVVRYLAAFNDKILAVDMEAGGLGQASHEESAGTGWVVVRGISDDASPAKNDDHHRTASWHAAVALRELLPYLRTRRDERANPGVPA